MARTDRCPSCYQPLHAERHADQPETVFIYCSSVACNPLLIANLGPKVEVEDEEWVGQ